MLPSLSRHLGGKTPKRHLHDECHVGPHHLGGKALADAAQNASAGVFQTVSSSLLMSVMACVSWSLKHRWHLLPSGMVQNGVCGEEPYRQPHRVCQWMFFVENWGARQRCVTLVEVFLIQHLPEMASRYFFTMPWTAFCVGMRLTVVLADEDPVAHVSGVSCT